MQDEVISWVRRRSNAFARGKSKFRGVSGRVGRWETRIGSFGGMKNVKPFSFSAISIFYFGTDIFRTKYVFVSNVRRMVLYLAGVVRGA